jgi:hypothetical protein
LKEFVRPGEIIGRANSIVTMLSERPSNEIITTMVGKWDLKNFRRDNRFEESMDRFRAPFSTILV